MSFGHSLNISALQAQPVQQQPFPYLVLSNFINPDKLSAITAGFPDIQQHGVFPLDQLSYGSAFADLVIELQAPELKALLEKKFNVDLSGRPPMVTVRGRARLKDGRIHADTKTKMITILLYMNETWDHEGGRLRLLRDNKNLENYVEEITPLAGTLLAFKVTDNCWHGHYPLEGERKSIMLNYITDEKAKDKHIKRHRFAAKVKRFRDRLGF